MTNTEEKLPENKRAGCKKSTAKVFCSPKELGQLAARKMKIAMQNWNIAHKAVPSVADTTSGN